MSDVTGTTTLDTAALSELIGSFIPAPVPGPQGPAGPAGPQGATGSGATVSNAVWLDSFPGTDDQKLAAAIKSVAAPADANTKPPMLLSNRSYTFANSYVFHSGYKLLNPFGFGNQIRGAKSTPCSVHFTGAGAFITFGDAQTFDVEIAGFALIGNSKATTFSTGSNVLWTSRFHDL